MPFAERASWCNGGHDEVAAALVPVMNTPLTDPVVPMTLRNLVDPLGHAWRARRMASRSVSAAPCAGIADCRPAWPGRADGLQHPTYHSQTRGCGRDRQSASRALDGQVTIPFWPNHTKLRKSVAAAIVLSVQPVT